MSPEESQENPNRMRGGIEFDAMLEELGFVETDELRVLRLAAQDAFLLGDIELMADTSDTYYSLGQKIVDLRSGQDYELAQIGFCIASGRLHRDTGKLQAYIDDLEDASMYARNRGYDDLVVVLEEAMLQADVI